MNAMRRAAVLLCCALSSLTTACTAGHARSAAGTRRAETFEAQALKAGPLAEFARRLPTVRAGLPGIIRSAEVAADRTLANPDMLINVPYAEQGGFAEEVLNRAGGLSNALPPEERPNLVTPQDVALVSVRSWEPRELDRLKGAIAKCKDSRIVLFASRKGMPAELPPGVRVDDLIDNGGTGEAEAAPVNALANILNAWLWTCEYTSALTRRDRFPGILYSVLMPGSERFDHELQTAEGRRFLGESAHPIAAGALSEQYLRRVDDLMIQLASHTTQLEVRKAAEAVAAHLNAGGTAHVATSTHLLLGEISESRRTPMRPFQSVGQVKGGIYAKTIQRGDYLVWIGYVGMGGPYEDYALPPRRAGAKLVTSFVQSTDPSQNAPDAVAHIEQHWKLPDAAIPVPFPPGTIAPLSGLDEGLIYRILEDEIAARLKPAAETQPVGR